MVCLKALKKEDLPYRTNLLNNIEVSQFLNTNEIFNIESTQNWFNKISLDPSREDFVFCSNTDKIGMGGIINISSSNSNCELYMYLDPKVHNRGFGYLACIALCDFAFKTLSLHKVFLYTFSDNIKANRLYEKVGFKLEGVLRNHTFKVDSFRDRNIYGLLRNEYLKL